MPASLQPGEQQRARALIAASLEDTVALAQWIACAFALLSALTAALTIAGPAPLTAAGTRSHPS